MSAESRSSGGRSVAWARWLHSSVAALAHDRPPPPGTWRPLYSLASWHQPLANAVLLGLSCQKRRESHRFIPSSHYGIPESWRPLKQNWQPAETSAWQRLDTSWIQRLHSVCLTPPPPLPTALSVRMTCEYLCVKLTITLHSHHGQNTDPLSVPLSPVIS